MSGALLVDTDVMVDYLRGRQQAVACIKTEADRVILSAIVVAELYAGVKDEAERAILDDVISFFRIVPVTPDIAKAGGLLKRDFGSSHGLGLADAIIAATAQVEDAELATLNTRHYPMFPGLRPAYVKD